MSKKKPMGYRKMPPGVFTSLLGTDAKVWAEAFVELHGGDEGLMIAWFSNAIMAGYDLKANQK